MPRELDARQHGPNNALPCRSRDSVQPNPFPSRGESAQRRTSGAACLAGTAMCRPLLNSKQTQIRTGCHTPCDGSRFRSGLLRTAAISARSARPRLDAELIFCPKSPFPSDLKRSTPTAPNGLDHCYATVGSRRPTDASHRAKIDERDRARRPSSLTWCRRERFGPAEVLGGWVTTPLPRAAMLHDREVPGGALTCPARRGDRSGVYECKYLFQRSPGSEVVVVRRASTTMPGPGASLFLTEMRPRQPPDPPFLFAVRVAPALSGYLPPLPHIFLFFIFFPFLFASPLSVLLFFFCCHCRKSGGC